MNKSKIKQQVKNLGAQTTFVHYLRFHASNKDAVKVISQIVYIFVRMPQDIPDLAEIDVTDESMVRDCSNKFKDIYLAGQIFHLFYMIQFDASNCHIVECFNFICVYMKRKGHEQQSQFIDYLKKYLKDL